MNFDFSDDQKMLKEQAHKFLIKNASTRVVRSIYDSEDDFDRHLWKEIGALGWCGTAIDEKYGGLGLGYLELCVLAEEIGRSLAPVPFASTLYLFAEAINLAGNEKQKSGLLSQIANGAIIGSFARAERPGPVRADKIEVRFQNGKLTGTKRAVPNGGVADYAVVLARANGSAEQGLQLVIANLKDVQKQKCECLDASRPHADLIFDGTAAEPLGNIGEGWMLSKRILERAAVLFAFEQVGGADACLDMAKDYALKRYAFGRPIGSFQAIKHKLADMYIFNELARSNAYYGAYALATNSQELPLAAASARVSATQAYDYAAKENMQTHGGIGFTWESDCHFYYKRSRDDGLVLGSQREWKERIVSELERGERQ